tara:strand:- start:7466 stop:7864 length:399 start_codon:yes stop_codon:yes gene_type:complete
MNTRTIILPDEIKEAIKAIEHGYLLFRDDDTPITSVDWYTDEKGAWQIRGTPEPQPPLIKISLMEYLQQREKKEPSRRDGRGIDTGGEGYEIGIVFGYLTALLDLRYNPKWSLSHILAKTDYSPTITTGTNS